MYFIMKNLQLYLSLGMKLTKIHRALKFKQPDWMKKYIGFNNKKRMNTANDYEKYLFKLMINYVYRKKMENIRKKISTWLVNNAENFLKFTSKPTYITHKIFDKNFAAIHEIKPVLILNKPTYVGFTIKLEDVYEEFFKHKHLFDFSNYPKDSKFFDETNKKVIGKMKDEFGGVIVIEFVGLKSKMYSMKKIDGKECNTAKGVSIATEFDKFKDVLFNEKIIRHKMKRIQSKKHKLGTYEINKISLSCFDDKRYVLDDKIINKVLRVVKKIKKDCDKKDYDNWKRLW